MMISVVLYRKNGLKNNFNYFTIILERPVRTHSGTNILSLIESIFVQTVVCVALQHNISSWLKISINQVIDVLPIFFTEILQTAVSP